MTLQQSMVDSNERRSVLVVVSRSAGYSPRFHDWLAGHWHVWEMFREASHALREKDVRGVSANTVVGLLRYKALLNKGEPRWENFSLTNTFNPDLARLYNQLHPVGLFSISTRFAQTGETDGT